ncbi:MAG: hypothetical protein BWZ07_03164 [Alphaproteobacteria bacterium ADurb.BinA280]|nr:MAG: hypothetical protein BWZ07_03164 [Alphaproteobacteria bacterium ADurb.BinA280]
MLAKLADLATATKQDAAKGVLDAISAAVAARATEATLAQIKTALDALDGKVATDAKLEAARALLASLDGKDYATQTTLAAVLAKLADPSTAAKQDAAKAVLDAISAAVAARATEATLAQIKTALTDGTQKVQLTGSLVETDKLRVLPVGTKAGQMVMLTLAQAIALTDKAIHFYDGGSWAATTAAQAAEIPNWGNYNRHALVIVNSHDQDVAITLMSNARLASSYDALVGPTRVAQRVTGMKNGLYYPTAITAQDMALLNEILPGKITMTMAAAEVPTAGSINIQLAMWSE